MVDRPAKDGEASGRMRDRIRAGVQDVSNIIKSFLGSNFIATPYAVSRAGYVAGPIGIAVISFIVWHACVLLLEVKRELCKQANSHSERHMDQLHQRAINDGGESTPMLRLASNDGTKQAEASEIQSYGDLAQAVFGKPGLWVINALLIFTQLGFCVGYIIFISSNSLALAGEDPSQSVYSWQHLVAVIISTLLCSALSLIQSVRTLGYISGVAAFFLFGSILAIVAGEFRFRAASYTIPFHFDGLLVFTDMITSALEGIGTVLPVQASMSGGRILSRRYERILAPVMCVVVIVLGGFGLCGYLSFGPSTNAVITLNFRPSPLTTVIQIAITLAVLGTFPLQLVPVVDVAIPRPEETSLLFRVGVRAALCFICGAIAYAIPFFGLISALVGSLGSSFLMFVVPPIALLKLQLYSQSYLLVVKNAALLTFGLLIAVFGGASAIKAIVAAV